jgi:hypothetical protein
VLSRALKLMGPLPLVVGVSDVTTADVDPQLAIALSVETQIAYEVMVVPFVVTDPAKFSPLADAVATPVVTVGCALVVKCNVVP